MIQEKPNSRPVRSALGGLFLLLLMASLACSLLTGNDQLNQAEKKWGKQGIHSYTIQVRQSEALWHTQVQTIIVRDDKVVDSSAECIADAGSPAGTCKLDPFDPNAYTVAGLFAEAQTDLSGQNSRWMKVSYDPKLGYPTQIAYNNPLILDGGWSWDVVKFEILK